MKNITIAVVGGGGVGKSALTIKYLNGAFVDYYDPTIEDCYSKLVTIDETAIMIEILDTAGQSEFSALIHSSLRKGNGCIFVYSITSKIGYHYLYECFVQKKRVNENAPMILIGNKCDKEDSREVSTKEGSELADIFNCKFLETSAKTGVNVNDAFTEIIKSV